MQTYTDQTFDAERALYGMDGVRLSRCTFAGPADGESAIKECADVQATDCRFALRYPLWHVRTGQLCRCTLEDTCRAALWYSRDIQITDSTLGGIKALRACDRVHLSDSSVRSDEFGWYCREVSLQDCCITGAYAFMGTHGLRFEGGRLTGKYAFQYVENAVIRNAVLDTKDAFWHGSNITVEDCEVRGEYLGWYSQGLRLVRCRIVGTQPLCYAQDLVLEDCEMVGCDFAFENSTVTATVCGHIDSVRLPAAGRLEADSIGEVLRDAVPFQGSTCEIVIR